MKTLQLQVRGLNLHVSNVAKIFGCVRYDKNQGGHGGKISYEDLGIAPVLGPGGESVAFLSVYLDESYGKGKPDLVVGGFVSSLDRWAGFASRWKVEVQEQFKIPYLHMRELMSEKSRIYQHLSTREKVRLFNTVLTVIKDHADLGVACRINPKEYVAITTSDERSFYGAAYTLAVLGCLQIIKRQLGEKITDTTLSVYLEDGHKNTNQAIDILQESWREQRELYLPPLPPGTIILRDLERKTEHPGVQLGTIAPGTKAQMIPLQAADLLAYGVLNVSGVLSPIQVFFTEVFNAIVSRVPIFVRDLSAENIRVALDNHLRELKEEAEERNKIAQVLGLIGGKVRKKGRGFLVNMKNVEEEDHRRLVEALKAGPIFIRKRMKGDK